MDDRIHVGHPFYFPTQVILVDDDPDFLEGVSLMLDSSISYQLFQSANDALQYVNRAHQHVDLLKRCYASYKTGPSVSDALSHIDIGKISQEVLNGNRFLTASTIIVDYSMPEMNGLEFLSELKNPFIRKVLLTGQGDMELAVKAFNHQLIDQFIDKHDPRLRNKMNKIIAAFQDQYFRSSYKLITDPLLASHHDAFLVDADFQHYFEALRSRLGIVEYYMTESPQTGFLLLTEEADQQRLLIFTDEDLSAHRELLASQQAPAALLRALDEQRVIPVYNDQDSTLDLTGTVFPRWKDWYCPAETVGAQRRYIVGLAGPEQVSTFDRKAIVSYLDFLESRFSVNEVLH